MRRAATVLLSATLAAGGMVALAPSASATDITPRDLTITVTNLGPEHRTCEIDADLYVPAGVTSVAPGARRCWSPTASAAPRRTRPTSPRASASTAT